MKKIEIAKAFYEKWLDTNDCTETRKDLTKRIDTMLREHLPEAVYDEYEALSGQLEAEVEEWAWCEGFTWKPKLEQLQK